MPEIRRNVGQKIPEEFRGDLYPQPMAGQNYGDANPHPEQDGPTAYDVKAANRLLHGLTDDQLKQIPILPPGSRLEQGATYIDLRSPDPVCREFTATGNLVADADHWYVPKDAVGYDLWDRLIGKESRIQNSESRRGSAGGL